MLLIEWYSLPLSKKGVGDTVSGARGLFAIIRQPSQRLLCTGFGTQNYSPPSHPSWFFNLQLAVICPFFFPAAVSWLTNGCILMLVYCLARKACSMMKQTFHTSSDTDDISFVCCGRFWWNGLFSIVRLPGRVDVSVREESVAYFSIRLRQMASETEGAQGSTV